MESELSYAQVYRIFKKSGAERISDEAVRELARFFQIYGEKIAKQANELANHAGRKTIKASDVRLAIKNIINIDLDQLK
ncbi:MAG: histone family protein [Nitrososphaeria archaeon]